MPTVGTSQHRAREADKRGPKARSMLTRRRQAPCRQAERKAHSVPASEGRRPKRAGEPSGEPMLQGEARGRGTRAYSEFVVDGV
jgi:hypothetical protein